ncbi:hypothetical protein NMR59_003444 [Vibrio cholerae]|nr:hypothetical protein [Vibrio cholerae]EJL6506968.1 hypothetical protein [Vibrio cholerae]EJY5653224.1 hypothetical protein [Vibrio cholerae]EKF9785760.1 hypothetical protein [Vibrio cholerae]EMB2712804.1 hypothetical protein [Vibrio cholerae]
MNSGEIIAMSAVVIAFFTSIVSIWQGYLNRQYYRLSTKPHITLERKSFEGAPYKYTLSNNGLGPAIVTRFEIIFDGEKLDGSINNMRKIMSLMELNNVPFELLFPTEGEAMAVSREIVLLEINPDHLNYESVKKLQQLTSCLVFKVEYKSIYGVSACYEGCE